MVHLASVPFNQLPPDSVCKHCFEDLQETEDLYHVLASELDLAGSPPKYVVHKNRNGEPYSESILHAACFNRWATIERTAQRAIKCSHCTSEVATLDGRRIERIFPNQIIDQPVLDASIEGWGDLELLIGPILDPRREIREQVEELLLAGRLSDEDRHSLIIWGARYNRMDIITLVTADWPISDIWIQMAIIEAIRHRGHIEVVRGLLATGFISEHWRGLAVKSAAEFGYTEIIRILLASGPIDVLHKESAIVLAHKNPPTEIEVIRLLLAHAPLPVATRERLVLHGVHENHTELVRALIGNGPITSSLMSEALRHAANLERGAQMIEILKKARSIPSPMRALLLGSTGAVLAAFGVAFLAFED